MARYQRPALNLNAVDVWGAAAAAQRINGSYIKVPPADENSEYITETNRAIISNFLSDTSLISDADKEQGELIRNYYKGLTFKILQGVKLNDFDSTALAIANRDVIDSSYDIAVIASLPSCYVRAKSYDDANARVRDASGHISTVGNKVTLDIEVIKCVYSVNYNVFFVTGLTSDNKAVFFSYRERVERGNNITVTGKVKAHRDDATQLSHTKVHND
jgi:hypothetical protein